jgi:long-chain acyl-CoA synthetase
MAEQFANLVDLCEKTCARFAPRPLFGIKEAGRWAWTTYGEFRDLVAACRGGLAALGVGPGDKVALISNNRVEWAACAYAAYGRGAAVVPMYEAQLPSEWEFILADCGAKIVFVANEAIAARLASLTNLADLRHIVRFDAPPEAPGSFAALLDQGRRAPMPPISPAQGVTANLIYTSGTTGKPKGVVLSHRNVVSNVNALHQVFPFEPEDRSLSFLPWAHAFGQMELHVFFSMGCALALNGRVTSLIEEMAEIKPTVLVVVPRIFSSLYAAVGDQLRGRPKFVQWLFRTGIETATRRACGQPVGLVAAIGLRLADALVFSKVRARFGGRLKYIICGGAALGIEIGRFLDALGLTIYEGYGLTETSPIVSANCPGHRRFGSCGQVIPDVRVVIDPAAGAGTEGEIVVYGPNVMQGYHNRSDESGALLPDGRREGLRRACPGTPRRAGRGVEADGAVVRVARGATSGPTRAQWSHSRPSRRPTRRRGLGWRQRHAHGGQSNDCPPLGVPERRDDDVLHGHRRYPQDRGQRASHERRVYDECRAARILLSSPLK